MMMILCMLMFGPDVDGDSSGDGAGASGGKTASLTVAHGLPEGIPLTWWGDAMVHGSPPTGTATWHGDTGGAPARPTLHTAVGSWWARGCRRIGEPTEDA